MKHLKEAVISVAFVITFGLGLGCGYNIERERSIVVEGLSDKSYIQEPTAEERISLRNTRSAYELCTLSVEMGLIDAHCGTNPHAQDCKAEPAKTKATQPATRQVKVMTHEELGMKQFNQILEWVKIGLYEQYKKNGTMSLTYNDRTAIKRHALANMGVVILTEEYNDYLRTNKGNPVKVTEGVLYLDKGYANVYLNKYLMSYKLIIKEGKRQLIAGI